jgi:hypothetical protein
VTPDAVDRAIAAEHPHLTGIRPVRYAGARPPSTLIWRSVIPGQGTVLREAAAIIADVTTGPDRAWPRSPALSHDDTEALRLLHARLAREQRRARAIGIGPIPWQTDDLTAADLDVLAVLLDGARVVRRIASEQRQLGRFVADLTRVVGGWLDEVAVTPRTVADPVEPVHETRCALAQAARTLVTEILLAQGVLAPERM